MSENIDTKIEYLLLLEELFKKEESGKTAPEIMKLIAQEWKKSKSDDS